MNKEEKELEEINAIEEVETTEEESSREPSELGEAISELIGEFLQFLMEKWGIHDPTKVLRECIEHREWFKGIVLSTAFFEGIGRKVLVDHFREQVAPERIEHLRLEQIILFLYASEIIDQSTYSTMMEVKDYRNNVVHLEPFTKPKLQPREAEKIIENTISCLEPLIEKWAKTEEREIQILKLPSLPKREEE